jgi:opacity protein-like surface antigen
MIKTLLTTAFALALTTAAFAADVTGKWTGKMETPNGSRDVVFDLKQDGEKLTGSTTGRGGDVQISDGSVKGDAVAFTVVRTFNGNEMKTAYTGKVAGSTLKLKFTMMDQDRELTLTKQ